MYTIYFRDLTADGFRSLSVEWPNFYYITKNITIIKLKIRPKMFQLIKTHPVKTANSKCNGNFYMFYLIHKSSGLMVWCHTSLNVLLLIGFWSFLLSVWLKPDSQSFLQCRICLWHVVMLTVGQKNTAAEMVEQSLVFVGNEGGKLIAFRNLIVEVICQLLVGFILF